jgi:hypothetical protein
MYNLSVHIGLFCCICSFLLFVWLFLFTYALLAVVYASHVEDRFLSFVICLSKHHHHHIPGARISSSITNSKWVYTFIYTFMYIYIYYRVHLYLLVLYIGVYIYICITCPYIPGTRMSSSMINSEWDSFNILYTYMYICIQMYIYTYVFTWSTYILIDNQLWVRFLQYSTHIYVEK